MVAPPNDETVLMAVTVVIDTAPQLVHVTIAGDAVVFVTVTLNALALSVALVGNGLVLVTS